jgi:hypothetical protein
MRRQTVAATFVAALFPGLASSQVPVGPEFQVNSYTTGIQASPRIASDAAGNFVATWFSIGQDGSSYGAFARRYDVSGTPVGPGEFRLNTFTLGIQSRPAVAAAPDGRLSFAWHTDNQDGSGLAIYSRLFDAAGAPTGGEFRVNTYTTGHQSLPSISADASGNFVVVWTDYGQQDGSGRGMFGQRFDSLGAAQGTEFRVNSYTTGNQYNFASAVAASADGRFVVVWESSGQDGSDGGVFAQRYDKTGVALGSEFQVNTHTPAFQINPSVASDPAGNFVVVWTSAGQPGGDAFDVVGRRYDAAGVPQGPEFIVNSETAGVQDYGKVAYDPRGNFVVVWDGYGPADSYDVFGRAFNHAGPVTARFRAQHVHHRSAASPHHRVQRSRRFRGRLDEQRLRRV